VDDDDSRCLFIYFSPVHVTLQGGQVLLVIKSPSPPFSYVKKAQDKTS